MRVSVSNRRLVERSIGGFTFAELLAAMVFVGVLLPVVVNGILIAHRAGAVAVEKEAAARWGENRLQEWVTTGDYLVVGSAGTVDGEKTRYEWELTIEAWDQNAADLVTLEVFYQVLGRLHSVRLATLAETL